ncbi:MAG: exonuclease domain-containing protein [Solirubrobacteraceae bacterium]
MSWVHGRLTAFDCETTSVDPFAARIVSVAVVCAGGDQPTERVVLLADPGIEIPAEATTVHGITTERVRRHGLPGALAVETAINAIVNRPVGSPLIVMNARYDLTVLQCEARRYRVTPLPERGELHVIDPRVIDLWLERYRRGSRRLADLCQHYGALLDGAHDAAADALAAARVAYAIGQHADVVRRGNGHDEVIEWMALRREWDRVRHDLPALHEAQIEWARDQAVGLAAHFAAKGQPQDVSTDWPIVREALKDAA